MFDERYLEQADALAQAERESGVEKARAGDNVAPVWAGNSASCPECGNENTARALLGYGRCIECQTRAERWGR